jgi:3-hydroxyisobutyrate dehydrogenase
MSRIAFLGLGAMGSRMAAHLVEAGHAVTVWNRSRAVMDRLVALGASPAASPRAAAESADFVMSMVTDDAASSAVWMDPVSGALAGLSPNATAIEISTVSPGWLATLSHAVTARHARFLDAPVAGTLPQAEARQLIFFVGGEEAVFEHAKPILAAMGGAVHHLGPAGQGLLFKLAVNGLLAVQIAALAEALGFLAEFGIDPAAAMRLLATLPIASPAGSGMGNLMVSGDFEPRFTASLMAKDLRYAAEFAAEKSVNLPAVQTARAVFETACDRGFASRNVTAVAKLYLR